ncbi:MAG: hypothetical protein EOP34_02630 [Rickettsiales bacterium]|nr:MAG: hypothetical protein EOP34_02630 [Rickettsiales bacterium]
MDNTDLENTKKILRKLENSSKQLKQIKKEISDELNDLKYDEEVSRLHHLALVKRENNQTLDAREEEAMAITRIKYPTIFDTEVLESDPEVETSPEYKERKQVKDVIEHVREVITFNQKESEKIEAELAETDNKRKTLEEKLKMDDLPSDYNPFDDLGSDKKEKKKKGRVAIGKVRYLLNIVFYT